MTDPLASAQCCFCGNAIVPMQPDPVRLTLCLDSEGQQDLFCHHRCLHRAMHPSVPLLLYDEA